MQIELEKYLLDRGLSEPDRELDREILETPELLAKAATAWSHGKEGILLVVRSRLMKIRQELLFKAVPQEVMVLRQALVEVASLLDDFERYSEANTRGIEQSAPKVNED